MNMASVAPVVHESEAQRQHVRVAMPGFVLVETAGEFTRCRIVDISAGGVSFEFMPGIVEGQMLRASILFPVEPVTVSLPVLLQVRSPGTADARIRCRFQGLGAAHINVLRFFITSLLAGDVLSTGDVMAVLARDNGAKLRKDQPASDEFGPGRKLRAAAFTAALALVGAVALAFTLHTAHDMLLVSHATAAKVTLPTTVVRIPRDATVFSLVHADGQVDRGAPIASFEAAPDSVSAESSTLVALRSYDAAAGGVKGTLTSPCDCIVRRSYVGNGTAAVRGARLFDLSPVNAKPYVLARFDFAEAAGLSKGSAVRLGVAGVPAYRLGHVSEIAIGEGGEISGDVLVTITPDQPLPVSSLDAPVQVSFGGYMPDPKWFDPRSWL